MNDIRRGNVGLHRGNGHGAAGSSGWLHAFFAGVVAIALTLLGVMVPTAAVAAEPAAKADIQKKLADVQGAGFTEPGTFEVGSLVRYQLTLSCSSLTVPCGPSVFTDVLDSGLTPVNVVLPQTQPFPITSSISGQTVTVNVGSAAAPWPASNSFEITVVARVNGTKVGVIPNQASITIDDGTGVPLDSKVVDITVPTPTPAWILDKYSGGNSTIAPGETATFHIRFDVTKVLGNVPISSGTLVDTFPAGALVQNLDGSVVPDGGTTSDGGVVDYDTHTITWTIPKALTLNSLNCNAAQTLCVNTDWYPQPIRLNFPAAAFPTPTTLTNYAEANVIYADGSEDTLTDSSNVILAAPSAAATMAKIGPSQVYPGGTVSWLLVSTNTGNTTGLNRTMIDKLPPATSGLTNLTLTQMGGPVFSNAIGYTQVHTVYTQSLDNGATWIPLYEYFPGQTWANTGIDPNATHVKMVVDSLAPQLDMRFGITATADPDAGLGDQFTNCGTVSGTGVTEKESCVTTTVTSPFTQIEANKFATLPDSTITSVQPGDTVKFTVAVRPTNGSPLTHIDVTDVLPAGFEYVNTLCTGSYYNQYSVACGTTTATVQPTSVTENADGTTTIQWLNNATPPKVYDGSNWWYTITYQARAKAGTAVANYTNTVYANSAVPNTTTNCFLVAQKTDEAGTDLNGNGSTTDTLCKATAQVQVRQAGIAEVSKWVKGDLGINALQATGLPSATCPTRNDGYTRYPCVSEVSRGGTFDYLFSHVNTGNIALTDFTMYDILPAIGDTGVNQTVAGTQRGTDWTPVMTGPVVYDPATLPANANPIVLYSYSADPCRPEMASASGGSTSTWTAYNWQGTANCANPTGGDNIQNTWYTAAEVLDWSKVKAFKTTMFAGVTVQANGWQPNQEIIAHLAMTAPTTAPESTQSPLNLSVAWNSIGYQASRLNSDGTSADLLPASPEQVGVIVPFPGVSIGDYVWTDTNRDGLQSPGEKPLAGVTVTLTNPANGIVSTTTTDANGYYSFQYLTPNAPYTLTFTAPDGMTFTTANAGGVTSNDPVADNGTTALDGTTGGDSDAIPSTDGKTGTVSFTSPGIDGSLNEVSNPTAETVADNPGIDAGFVSTINLKLDKALTTAGPFSRGQSVTFTLTPSNEGPMAALPGWTVTDLAPTGMTLTAASGGTNYKPCSVTADKVICESLMGLGAGATAAPITVTATINSDAVLGSTMINVAYVAPLATDVEETNTLGTPPVKDTDVTNPATPTDNDDSVSLTLANAVSIGDYVWFDNNRDGIQGSTTDEPAVPNVIVELYKDGSKIGEATTDTDGFYSFTGLTPGGAYTVKFIAPTGTTFTTQTSTGSAADNDSNPNVATGEASVIAPASGNNSASEPDDPTIDAGLVQYNLVLTKELTSASSVNPGDTVTFTLSPSNEGPSTALAGWSVTEVLPTGLTLMSMKPADADAAAYNCSGNKCTGTTALAGGTSGAPILVTATVDSTFTNGTLKNVAYVDKLSTDVVAETNPLGDTPPTTTTDTGESSTDNDDEASVTVTPLVSIGDYVWYDNNRNGIQDNGEPLYAGMKVELLEGESVLRTTTTSDTGYYVFANLAPSTTYTVRFTPKAGESFTTQTVSTGTVATDSNPDAGGLAEVTTPADGRNRTEDGLADDPTIDAGVVKYNLVLTKSLVPGGPYYEGSTVTFTLTPSNEGPATALAGWSVTDVLPDGLTLESMAPAAADAAAYECIDNVCTGQNDLLANTSGAPITVTATVNADFVGDAKNVAYVDKDGDDVPETNPLSDPVPDSTTDTKESSTDNDAEAPITVDSLVSMGDYVWWDVNRNGIQDGEAAVKDVVVTLYKQDGTLVTDTKTDGSGFYSFTDLTPGAGYYVIFTKPTDAAFTTVNSGADDTVDSDANVATGRVDFTAAASGSNSASEPDDPTVDAGLIKINLALSKKLVTEGPFGAGDTVTYTLTPHNDGPVDALVGWQVQDLLPKGLTLGSMTGDESLYDCSGATCTSKVALGAGQDGSPITVTATIDGYTTGSLKNVAWIAPGPNETTETNVLVVPSITTDTDESKTDNDAQAVLDLTPVSVGDYVWWDVNRNGVQDKGESPIQDVVVTLYQADGTTKVTDTKTDDKGFYSFTDLAPGQNYVIVFTKPDGTTFTTALQGDVATDSNPNNSGVAPFVTPKSGSNSATNPDLPTIDAGLVQLNLTLKKVRVTQGPFGSSDLVTYTLTPHNDGPVNALTGWTVTDHLPVGLTLVSMTGDAAAYSCDSASGICTSKVGLDAGKDAAPITVTARINAYTTGILQNVAWVSPGPGETPETNQLVVPTLPAPGQPPVETGATETDNDADASLELLPVSVGDYVWWDVNRNGTQDNGEAPVAGVVVTLFQADGTTRVASTVTNANGFYSFTDLAPGQPYVMVFTKPDGSTFTTQTVGSDIAVDSNPDVVTGVAPFVTPKTGTNSATKPDNPMIDAGLVKLNLTLTKNVVGHRGTYAPGDTVRFVLVPSNDGPVNALPGWSVTDVLPDGLTMTSIRGEGYSCDLATATCVSSVVLPAGGSGAPIWIEAKITATGSGSLRNVAFVKPTPGDVIETNPLGPPPGPGTDTSTTPTDNDSDVVIKFTTPPTPPKPPLPPLAYTGAGGLGMLTGTGVLLTILGLLLARFSRRREEEQEMRA